MVEGLLLPSFKEQHALKLKQDKEYALVFLKEFLEETEIAINMHCLIKYYKRIPLNLDHKAVLKLFRQHYKEHYISLRNKGWYLKVQEFKYSYEIVLTKANILNRVSWSLKNLALNFEKLYLGG